MRNRRVSSYSTGKYKTVSNSSSKSPSRKPVWRTSPRRNFRAIFSIHGSSARGVRRLSPRATRAALTAASSRSSSAPAGRSAPESRYPAPANRRSRPGFPASIRLAAGRSRSECPAAAPSSERRPAARDETQSPLRRWAERPTGSPAAGKTSSHPHTPMPPPTRATRFRDFEDSLHLLSLQSQVRQILARSVLTRTHPNTQLRDAGVKSRHDPARALQRRSFTK